MAGSASAAKIANTASLSIYSTRLGSLTYFDEHLFVIIYLLPETTVMLVYYQQIHYIY